MTVQSDLQKALAAAESAKGTYATFEQCTDDQTAKQMYSQMSSDMDQHINQINSRLVTAQKQLNNQADYSSSSNDDDETSNNLLIQSYESTELTEKEFDTTRNDDIEMELDNRTLS